MYCKFFTLNVSLNFKQSVLNSLGFLHYTFFLLLSCSDSPLLFLSFTRSVAYTRVCRSSKPPSWPLLKVQPTSTPWQLWLLMLPSMAWPIQLFLRHQVMLLLSFFSDILPHIHIIAPKLVIYCDHYMCNGYFITINAYHLSYAWVMPRN